MLLVIYSRERVHRRAATLYASMGLNNMKRFSFIFLLNTFLNNKIVIFYCKFVLFILLNIQLKNHSFNMYIFYNNVKFYGTRKRTNLYVYMYLFMMKIVTLLNLIRNL